MRKVGASGLTTALEETPNPLSALGVVVIEMLLCYDGRVRRAGRNQWDIERMAEPSPATTLRRAKTGAVIDADSLSGRQRNSCDPGRPDPGVTQAVRDAAESRAP